MAELKTKRTARSVGAFLAKIADADARKDCKTLVSLMESATKAKGRMWGTSIVGFGDKRLRYDSGRELDWFVMGFSPRKAALTLYLPGYLATYEDLLGRLGKHTTGKGCLYIRRLEDVDAGVLKKLVNAAAKA